MIQFAPTMNNPLSKRYKSVLYILLTLSISFGTTAQTEFITTWQTDNTGTSGSTEITIPTSGSGYNYNVDWNDDGVFDEFGLTGSVTHDFGTAGTYTIRIQGDFPRIFFNNGGDRQKILDVSQWGNIQWSSFNSAFQGCSNVDVTATDAPDLSNVTTLFDCFRDCGSLVTSIDHWDVSTITVFAGIFEDTPYNQQLNSWDVSSGQNFNYMFWNAAFNQDINGWDMSSATSCTQMFYLADFNQDISSWDVSGVSEMGDMFRDSDFNQDIGNWNVSSATNMNEMFRGTDFNFDISGWDVNGVTNMSGMFRNSQFDQNLGDWDMSTVTNVNDMFNGCNLTTANYDSTLIGWAAQTVTSGLTLHAGNSNYCAGEIARNVLTTAPNSWGITDNGLDCSDQEFISTWKTDNAGSSSSTEITIPTNSGSFAYNYDVDWDNDGIYDEFNLSGNVTHDFGTAGVYTIRIRGFFPQIFFNDSGDKEKITDVAAWGNIEWRSGESAFYGCSNLTISASDIIQFDNATDLSDMFRGCTTLNSSSISNWDVLGITDMSGMFRQASSFNQSLNTWEMDSVTTLNAMFRDAHSFNGAVSNWNVSNVENLNRCFRADSAFNQDISGWNVSSVTNTREMFMSAVNFNQDIDAWDVSEVENMEQMFYDADAFNQNLNSWNTQNVEDFTGMFRGADNFNGNISSWNTGSGDEFESMFRDAIAFNQDIGGWNLSNTFSTEFMFAGATVFNQNISMWNMSNVRFMQSMFENAITFNQDISGWNVVEAIEMNGMFKGAASFNQDIGGWNTSNLETTEEMFYGAVSFDQNLGDWYIENLEDADSMFHNVTLSTSNYDSLLIGWASQSPNLEALVKFSGGNSQYCNGLAARGLLTGSYLWTIDDGGQGCTDQEFIITVTTDNSGGTSGATEFTIPTTGSGYNYNVDWDNDGTSDELGITGDVTHDFGTAGTYTIRILGEFPRIHFNSGGDDGKLVSIDQWGTNSWTSMESAFWGCSNMNILATDAPDLSNVSSMSTMFRNCSSLNADLNSWDVSNVQSMIATFRNCDAFNSDLDNWNVSNVDNMRLLFTECLLFNGNITNWNTQLVDDFQSTFENAPAFNQDISGWNTSSALTMQEMFKNATAFDQDLGMWDVSNVTNFVEMFNNATLSTANYDNLLIGWNAQTLQPSMTFDGGNSQYCSAEAERAAMIANDFWGITDGGIDDLIAPTPDVAVLTDVTSTCVITSLVAPTATDNCVANVTVTNDATLPITSQGTTIVTWTYDDGRGNTSTQTQNVIIDDITAPAPDALSLSDINEVCEVTALTTPTATDECAASVLVTNDATLPITAQGTTVVTWTYDDGHGNTTTQTQNVIISDNTAPVPDLPILPSINAECEVTSLTPPTATDNCTSSVTVTNDATLPISTLGTTVVTWTFDDGNGNTTTQTQDVIIDDLSDPVPDLAQLPTVNEECEVTALTAPTATDNCAGTVAVSNDAVLPITTPGTTVVTWTYDDGNGNSSTQTQDIVIADVTAPTPDVATLADIEETCQVTSLTEPTATDNCSNTITVSNDVTLPITASTLVTWTYDDGNGNTSTQTQNVNIVAVNVATSVASDGITLEAENVNSGVSYQWIDCNTNQAIAGETNQSFTPTAGGDYAVIITENGCTDTSACVNSTVSLDEFSSLDLIVYPNPTSGNFFVKYEGQIQNITLVDIVGREIPVDVDLNEGKVSSIGLPSGQYMVLITLENNQVIQKPLMIK